MITIKKNENLKVETDTLYSYSSEKTVCIALKIVEKRVERVFIFHTVWKNKFNLKSRRFIYSGLSLMKEVDLLAFLRNNKRRVDLA